jgi:hypothetical protein
MELAIRHDASLAETKKKAGDENIIACLVFRYRSSESSGSTLKDERRCRCEPL